jgi:transcriptional regulator with XRE-family HTH domain
MDIYYYVLWILSSLSLCLKAYYVILFYGVLMSVTSICARIKAVREALGISQKAFSNEIYLSHSFYSKLERGERNPNSRICQLLSNKYNVNKDWLMTGEGGMFSAPPPDVELDQLKEIINELDPLFREYIIRQIKQLADLYKKSKEGQKTPRVHKKP